MGKGTGKGVDKKIKSPQHLWELFLLYKQWAKDNPITIEDYVGKEAQRVLREKPRALTVAGFNVFLDEQDVIVTLKDYFSNKEDRYTDFAPICSRVRNHVRANQIEGGLAGVLNASITQRLNGLHEHVKTEDVKPKAIKVTVVKKGGK
jgi:hypothetical protein